MVANINIRKSKNYYTVFVLKLPAIKSAKNDKIIQHPCP